MQNPRATTSLKPGGGDVNIAKYLSQMNIVHHCRKWKLPILGVEQIVLRDVFLASIFLAYVEPKLLQPLYSNGLRFEVQYCPDIVQCLLADYEVIQRFRSSRVVCQGSGELTCLENILQRRE